MRSKQSTITIHDVAKAAGVSVSTASRVLNNKADVSPETYKKVRQVIDDLNYTASLAAKSMRSRTTNVLGLLVPELIEVYYHEVIKGVGAAIENSGYDLLIYTSGSPTRNKRASWEREHVALLSSGLTDGCIIVSPSAPTFQTNANIVVIDPHGAGAEVPSVVATNHEGAIQAVDYLVSLGHRRIGFIQGHPTAWSALQRFEGYKAGLHKAGIEFEAALVCDGDFTSACGKAATYHLMNQPNPPSAIFAANDRTAIGVLEAAQELGLNVPQDLSVIGFDNIPETMQTTPRLTTIDQSIREMGSLGVRLLIDMLQNRESSQLLHTVPTSLVIRDSCWMRKQ